MVRILRCVNTVRNLCKNCEFNSYEYYGDVEAFDDINVIQGNEINWRIDAENRPTAVRFQVREARQDMACCLA